MRCGLCRKPPADQQTCTDYPCGLRTGQLEAGFAVGGFADGYDQGWRDAKAGRPYGSTPAGQRTPRFDSGDGR